MEVEAWTDKYRFELGSVTSFMSSVGTKALQTVWNGPNTGCLAPGVRQRAKEKKRKKRLID